MKKPNITYDGNGFDLKGREKCEYFSVKNSIDSIKELAKQNKIKFKHHKLPWQK
jgi:hypothetical protein